MVRVVEFGAFVEILPGTDGLLHVSEMAHHRVNNVHDEVKEGDQVLVKVVSIDPSGKIRLSRKALLEEAQGGTPVRGRRAAERAAASHGARRPQPRRTATGATATVTGGPAAAARAVAAVAGATAAPAGTGAADVRRRGLAGLALRDRGGGRRGRSRRPPAPTVRASRSPAAASSRRGSCCGAARPTRLVLSSADGEHCFAIDALRIEKRVRGGQPTRLDLTPDRPGTFTLLLLPRERQAGRDRARRAGGHRVTPARVRATFVVGVSAKPRSLSQSCVR